MNNNTMPTLQSLGRIALCSAAILAGAAQAHNVWLEPDARGGYLIQFGGHAGQLEAFAPEKLQSVRAFDRRGRGVEARVEPAQQGLRAILGHLNAPTMGQPELFLRYTPEVFPGNGVIGDQAMADRLSAYLDAAVRHVELHAPVAAA